jgi:hypothetical protein
LGLCALYLLVAAPVLALSYAVPMGLLAALGIGLLTHRGTGLLLLSMVLGAVLATLGVLGVLGVSGEGSAGAYGVVAALYGGSIIVCSIMGVRSARMGLTTMRTTQAVPNERSRIPMAVFIGYVVIGTVILIVPLLFALAWSGSSLFR